MVFAFLSSRLRTWLLLSVLAPVFGSLLRKVGVRIGDRHPRTGGALQKAGGYAGGRRPRGARR